MTASLPIARSEHRLSESPSGADLLGWSALPLLGETDLEGPWLFLTAESSGWISRDRLSDARFSEVTVRRGNDWPFADGSLAGVVLDGDVLADGTNEDSLDQYLAEAHRTSGSDTNVLIACSERRLPRRLRDLRRYGRHSAHLWRRAIQKRGGQARTAAFLDLDGPRVTTITLTDVPAADRIVLRSSRRDAVGQGTIRAMASSVSRHVGDDLHVERVGVRKIGKTAVFLVDRAGRRFIMRIARSPIARSRGERNFTTLALLRASSLPTSHARRVPEATFRGTFGPYEYFVEECLNGGAGPSPRARRRDGWPIHAVDYLLALHSGTAEPITIEDGALARLVRDPLARLASGCGSPAVERVARRLGAYCETVLRGRRLPLVRTHGDFTESNCLFDDRGELVGVVDWELSDARGLPFVDLLQLMPVDGEDGRHPRWQRFDSWLELWQAPERVVSNPVLGPYVQALGLEPPTIPAMVLIHWLNHVADRIDARRDDERWMRLRVWQPFETIGRILCD